MSVAAQMNDLLLASYYDQSKIDCKEVPQRIV